MDIPFHILGVIFVPLIINSFNSLSGYRNNKSVVFLFYLLTDCLHSAFKFYIIIMLICVSKKLKWKTFSNLWGLIMFTVNPHEKLRY